MEEGRNTKNRSKKLGFSLQALGTGILSMKNDSGGEAKSKRE
jgi:hypothetical protein